MTEPMLGLAVEQMRGKRRATATSDTEGESEVEEAAGVATAGTHALRRGVLVEGAAWWTKERVIKILELIQGRSDPPFLAQVINNKRCGIDVDRLDYMERDSHHALGERPGLDVDRIIRTAVIDEDNNLAWPVDEVHLLEHVFATRHLLFAKLYTHPDVLVADAMV